MTILLTGSNGYLGNVLSPILKGDVLGIDLGIFKHHSNYRTADLSQDIFDRIFDESRVVGEFETVVHLAGISNDPSSELDPKLTERMNVDASKRLIDFASASGVKRFIFASSASVYGANNDLVNEESAKNPQSLYAKSKLEIESYLLDHENLNPVIFRFGTLFGVSPKMRFDVAINLMVRNAVMHGEFDVFGNGEQYRPFLHVRDAAKVIQSACEYSGPGIYNIAHSNIRIKSLAEIVSSVLGAKINYRSVDHPDTRNYKMSCSKSRRNFPQAALPDISLVSGIKELAAWVSRNNSEDVDYYTIEAWKRYLNDSVL